MESIPSIYAKPAVSDAADLVEDLPEWKVDSTLQLRVNNVCSKLIRRVVHPTYQRVRANLGETPARLIRAAMKNWTDKVLPSLYSPPRIEWAAKPKAISPKIAELFEEMWLQAVSAAQTHYEVGDDSSARLTHRETIEMVCHELRRLTKQVSSLTTSAECLSRVAASNCEAARDASADAQWFRQTFDVELAQTRDLARGVEQMLAHVKVVSERQSTEWSQHLEFCRAIQRAERARSSRIRRLSSMAIAACGRKEKKREGK
jgi:hypothetical protein